VSRGPGLAALPRICVSSVTTNTPQDEVRERGAACSRRGAGSQRAGGDEGFRYGWEADIDLASSGGLLSSSGGGRTPRKRDQRVMLTAPRVLGTVCVIVRRRPCPPHPWLWLQSGRSLSRRGGKRTLAVCGKAAYYWPWAGQKLRRTLNGMDPGATSMSSALRSTIGSALSKGCENFVQDLLFMSTESLLRCLRALEMCLSSARRRLFISRLKSAASASSAISLTMRRSSLISTHAK
jgi:hypothetical protein